MDNGSSHRGDRCIERLRSRWPTIIPVHTPIHASWLNQVEIYFSIVQRKVLTPNDFRSLAELEEFGCSGFNSTMRRSRGLSSGSSLVPTSQGYSLASRPTRRRRYHWPPEYVTELPGRTT
jgi:hypothetical protein